MRLVPAAGVDPGADLLAVGFVEVAADLAVGVDGGHHGAEAVGEVVPVGFGGVAVDHGYQRAAGIGDEPFGVHDAAVGGLGGQSDDVVAVFHVAGLSAPGLG